MGLARADPAARDRSRVLAHRRSGCCSACCSCASATCSRSGTSSARCSSTRRRSSTSRRWCPRTISGSTCSTRSRRCSRRCATRSSTRRADRRGRRSAAPRALLIPLGIVLGVVRARRLGVRPRGAAGRREPVSELTTDERAELEALRARVAALERERAEQVGARQRRGRRGAGARVLARPLAPRPQRADGDAAAPPSSARRVRGVRAVVRRVRAAQAPPAADERAASRSSSPSRTGRATSRAARRGRARRAPDVEVLVIDSGSRDGSAGDRARGRRRACSRSRRRSSATAARATSAPSARTRRADLLPHPGRHARCPGWLAALPRGVRARRPRSAPRSARTCRGRTRRR